MRDREEPELLTMVRKHGKWPIIGLVLLMGVCIANPLVCIDAGHRGVVKNFGAVSETVLGEGIHLRIPIMQSVEEINVQVKKDRTKASAASKDLQEVSATITINYHPDPNKINTIYQKIGTDYAQRVIDPAVQEIVKATTAQYTAEQLITKRAEVSLKIETGLVTQLKKFYIIMDQFSMEDFSFSDSFQAAIEAKVKAKELAQKAENDLVRVKFEADQRVAKAKAQATAYKLKSRQLTPMMVRMEWIKKWKGEVPNIITGNKAGMFLKIDK
jgi:regulator of protease activity HflC (stomatin/prohibitin superfamily)